MFDAQVVKSNIKVKHFCEKSICVQYVSAAGFVRMWLYFLFSKTLLGYIKQGIGMKFISLLRTARPYTTVVFPPPCYQSATHTVLSYIYFSIVRLSPLHKTRTAPVSPTTLCAILWAQYCEAWSELRSHIATPFTPLQSTITDCNSLVFRHALLKLSSIFNPMLFLVFFQ